MKEKDLINTNKIKNFTIKCLLNDFFPECKNACLEILEKVNSIDEFIEAFLSRKDLRKYQGYWELAKEQGINTLRNMAIEYLEDNRNKCNMKIKTVTTISDKGCIKVGNYCFSVGISNQYGDCLDNVVYIIEEKNSGLNLDFAKFITDIEGTKMYIYNYDCGNDKGIKLNGTRYGIYAIEKLVIFKKWD